MIKDKVALDAITEAVMKRILHRSKHGPPVRQKFLHEFSEFYTPQPFGEKKTYSQNWPIYYQACRSEKLAVFKILKDVVEYLHIPPPRQTNGRPSADVADIIKALCVKAYCGLSSWRVESELKIAKSMGVLNKVYKRSALNSYLGKPEITLWLHKLYQAIAQPLASIETQLAVDATGISVSYGRKRWVEVRTEFRKHKDYKKLHAIVGCKTNVIFAAAVTRGSAHDSPPFENLLKITSEYVSAKELSADPAYLSRKNAGLIASKGMVPYILPTKNVRALNKGESDGAWGRMIHLWQDYRSLFAMHYHQRSNVESTFGMLKRKFGYHTRAKSEVGQTNETLTKVVCLNACILAEGMLEFNLETPYLEARNKKH